MHHSDLPLPQNSIRKRSNFKPFPSFQTRIRSSSIVVAINHGQIMGFIAPHDVPSPGHHFLLRVSPPSTLALVLVFFFVVVASFSSHIPPSKPCFASAQRSHVATATAHHFFRYAGANLKWGMRMRIFEGFRGLGFGLV